MVVTRAVIRKLMRVVSHRELATFSEELPEALTH